MNAPFFIVSLPRCRTAWLANLLTFGPAFCLHDGLKHCETPRDLQDRFAATAAQFPGDADPSIPLFFPEINRLFPDARYVFISRDPEICRSSYEASICGLSSDLSDWSDLSDNFERLRTALASMHAALRHRHCLDVRFEDLDQPATVAAIWNFCVPDVPFNPLRWEMLHELRITAIPDKVSKRLDIARIARLFARAQPSPGAPIPVPGSDQTNPLKRQYHELLSQLCAPQPAAYHWLIGFLNLALTWDHIQDNDPIDKAIANWAFESIVLDWPINVFWTQHAPTLRPVLAAALTAWRHSDSPHGDPRAAWQPYADIPLAVALLLGGRERVAQFSDPIRNLVAELYQEHQA